MKQNIIKASFVFIFLIIIVMLGVSKPEKGLPIVLVNAYLGTSNSNLI